jgi:hypothetical protein
VPHVAKENIARFGISATNAERDRRRIAADCPTMDALGKDPLRRVLPGSGLAENPTFNGRFPPDSGRGGV